MSRSYRKTPITEATTTSSKKAGKKHVNRAFRRAENMALTIDHEPPFSLNQIKTWFFAKDGKSYWSKVMLKESSTMLCK